MEPAILFLFLSSLPGAQAQSRALAKVQLAAEYPTRFVGRVLGPDGLPAPGSRVVSSAGGECVTATDGSFALDVDVPLDAASVELIASGDEDHADLVAALRVPLASFAATTPVGSLLLAPQRACGNPRWRPEFGGVPGTDGEIRALALFDDGTGAALYVGGDFAHAGGIAARGIARLKGGRWSALASPIEGNVLALVVFDDGSGDALYAGGSFSVPSVHGGLSGIARWDGEGWSGLAGVPDDEVRALAVHDDGSGPALYAGGQFTQIGAVSANQIARWNGASWSTVGGGVDGGIERTVEALLVFDDGSGPALFAAGRFAGIGGVPAARIAKWNGAAWSNLGTGVGPSIVYALAAFDDGSGPALYAGGRFETAGGVETNSIAKWDGASWSALGSGLAEHEIHALAAYDDGTGAALYAGGDFTAVGGTTTDCIARWDGAAWSAFPTGEYDMVDDVEALLVVPSGSRDLLVAGGDILTVGDAVVLNLGAWDGSQWTAVGRGQELPSWPGTGSSVMAMIAHDDGQGEALFVGGNFFTAGPTVASAVARWDGTRWAVLGSRYMDPEVRCFARFDDGQGPMLYAGGTFHYGPFPQIHHIGKWDGREWRNVGSALTTGVGGLWVDALAVHDDGGGPALYVGGRFGSAGGTTLNSIARWDGTSWSAVGGGMSADSSVSALAVHDDGSGTALYAGGSFAVAGGAPANRIARWDGSAWSEVGGGIDGHVRALAVHDDGGGPALYAGGEFASAGGVPVSHVAKWDGAAWHDVGGGTSGGPQPYVLALASFDDGSGRKLFAGGGFTSAGGVTASRVARWDGAQWSALAGGVSDDRVRSFAVFDDGNGPMLYVSGGFTDSPAGDRTIGKWGCNKALGPIAR